MVLNDMSPKAVRCNLVVLRSRDLDRAAAFYSALGLDMSRHAHGSGPVHLTYENAGHVFEIYPLEQDSLATTATRIGFSVSSVVETYAALLVAGGQSVSAPKSSAWGKRAVVSDPDGHRVELTEGTVSNAKPTDVAVR